MVESGGLENRYPARDLGFESLPLRQFLGKPFRREPKEFQVCVEGDLNSGKSFSMGKQLRLIIGIFGIVVLTNVHAQENSSGSEPPESFAKQYVQVSNSNDLEKCML